MRIFLVIAFLAAACGEVPRGQPDAQIPPPQDAGCMKVWYADCDGDGIAALDTQIQMSCSAPSAPPTKCSGGKWTDTAPITGAGDCDDTRADVHPGAPEICD